ncbi:MAG: IPT/TIG domain-containing protein [Acidobacteria bacterium]|nr:IPT/TIG domain-containing protein [Acidobacteriota bacterium]MBI3487865.1 IPT/TIG domain-containing protein [Acidobacteriota bacterium]
MGPNLPQTAWLVLALSVALCGAEVPPQQPSARATSSPHGHMPLDPSLLDRWERERTQAPVPTVGEMRATPQTNATTANFLSDVSTQGALRDQGANGNCWVWAGSAMAEVALKASYGYQDSLSIQYVDSLMNEDNWRKGGTLTAYCDYVNGAKRLVPWANANAAYVDGIAGGLTGRSLIPTAAIQQVPAYTQVMLQGSTVPTAWVSQAEAIAAIKRLLDARRAVSFSFITQFGGPGGFDEWWENNPESAVWPEPLTGPKGTPDGNWGAHMIVLVGYDMSDPSPANHCWIVLNSWGTPVNRPQGLLRLPMAMKYDASFTLNGTTYRNYAFEALDLSADHPTATVPSLSVARSSNQPKLGLPFTFTVTASGYPPFSYQWRKDGQAIPGATSAAYTLPYLTEADGGHSFDVVVSNQVGGAGISTSSTIHQMPSLSGQQQLLTNPGFEDGVGQTAWALKDNPGASGSVVVQKGPASCRSGSWSAAIGYANRINGYSGALEQTLTLPTGPGTILLNYWAHANTGIVFGPGRGTLSLKVLDATTREPLLTGRTQRNLEPAVLLWSQEQLGLSDLKGRRVTLRLEAEAALCQWSLDDFAITLDPADTTPLPVIASFNPASGNPGDTVVLTGSGFTGTSLVQFHGLLAPFTVDSDTQITATVPRSDSWGADAVTTGTISVNTPAGTGNSATPFQVLRPKILAHLPASATRGTPLVLSGSGFTGVSKVTFDGVAGPALAPATFQVDGDTQITTIIPAGAISGNVTVTNPYGTSTCPIRVLPNGPVTVTITPRPQALLAGTAPVFTAAVTGDLDQRVIWQYQYSSQKTYFSGSDTVNPLSVSLDPTPGTLTLSVLWYGDFTTVSDTLTLPVKSPDFLGTGTISALDMLELAKHYGRKAGDPGFNPAMDLDGNGIVDDADLTIFLAHY